MQPLNWDTAIHSHIPRSSLVRRHTGPCGNASRIGTGPLFPVPGQWKWVYDGRGGGGSRVGGDIGVCVIIGVLRLSVIKDEMLLL